MNELMDLKSLPLDLIRPSAVNPRRSFNTAADAELLESIQAHGLLTPLLVRPLREHGNALVDRYEVVAGHRRLAAAQELGLDGVPVTIRELTDDQARETAIVENLHREDLAPLDEAESYQALLAIPGASPASVAAAVGKTPAYIGRRLKLLGLVDAAKHALRDGRMDVARAELLAKLGTELQVKALDEAVWLPIYTRNDQAGTLETLEPLSDLREWVERRTRLSVVDLVMDAGARALFPDAVELVEATPTEALLEVALDRFSQSPAKDTIPTGVLRLNKDFREVVGKKCKFAKRALVVIGDRVGDVVAICCERQGPTTCAVHWPLKAKADPADKPAPSQSWEVQQAERKRLAVVWERVKPDVEKVIIAATTLVRTTPKLLQEILADRRLTLAPVLKALGGKLTLDNFGRAWVLADALEDLYDHTSAERALKAVHGVFNVEKAMKAAEAALAVETAAVKAEAKKGTGKPAKKGRAA